MAIFYVDSNGSNNANGSSGSPFKTINQALDSNLKAGDEIVVRAGTYKEALNIDKGGSAAADLTIRSEVPGGAKIEAPSGAHNVISVNANYVTIEGFEISGGNGDGIEGNSVHHITVKDNIIHDNGESGVQFNYSEFLIVEGNETYSNASSGWFSGISIFQNRNVSGDTTTKGYRTIIKDNNTHDNVTKGGAHTDGNGIIIDDFQSTQTDGYPNYTYPTLVEGNTAHGNGGKGIQVTWSDQVTVSGNTAWHNNVDQQNDGTWRGEISNAQSSNNTFVNNIAVADPGIHSQNTAIDNNSYGGYSNDNVVWENNLIFNGKPGQNSVKTDGGNSAPSASDGNLIGVNPNFVDPGKGDFNLGSGSPAIGAGTNNSDLGAQGAGSDPVTPTPPVDATPVPPVDDKPTPPVDVNPKPPVDVNPKPPVDDKPTDNDKAHSLWSPSDTPAIAVENDKSSVELGMRFQVTTDGEIEAFRVWRGDANDADMPVTLWAADGTKIATATFADTDSQGWQEVRLDSPVAVQAGQTYTVSYHAPQGQYAVSENGFNNGMTSGSISVESGAGVFNYGSGGSAPTQSYNNSNYWIDVVFDGTDEQGPGGVVTPTPPTDDTPTPPVDEKPTPPVDDKPTPPVDDTPTDADDTFSLWSPSDTPRTAVENDSNAVELGMQFEVTTDGEIEAFRVWRGDANDADMPVTLWAADGTKIATATFVDTDSQGWQEVKLDSPIKVEAGQTYTVSYNAPQGNYAVSEYGFNRGMTSGPITVKPGAGVFGYGSGDSAPTESYNKSNYWIDVVFDQTPENADTFVFNANSQPDTGTDLALADMAAAESIAPQETFASDDVSTGNEIAYTSEPFDFHGMFQTDDILI